MPRDALRTARMVAATGLGLILVGAGAVMLVAPGPGVLAIAAGTTVLGRYHPAVARLRTRWLTRLRTLTGRPEGGPDAA